MFLKDWSCVPLEETFFINLTFVLTCNLCKIVAADNLCASKRQWASLLKDLNSVLGFTENMLNEDLRAAIRHFRIRQQFLLYSIAEY